MKQSNQKSYPFSEWVKDFEVFSRNSRTGDDWMKDMDWFEIHFAAKYSESETHDFHRQRFWLAILWLHDHFRQLKWRTKGKAGSSIKHLSPLVVSTLYHFIATEQDWWKLALEEVPFAPLSAFMRAEVKAKRAAW
jgi:hypothetical protein